MTELKPCPFCGGEAHLYVEEYGLWEANIVCHNDITAKGCPGHMRLFQLGYTKEEATDKIMKRWNTRANNWHTGTPTKEDWYFVMWKDTDDNWTRFSALMWNNGNKTWYDDVTPETNWGDEYHAEVIAYMPIPPFKGEEVNG